MSEQASSWASAHQLTYPVMIDPEGEASKKFGIAILAPVNYLQCWRPWESLLKLEWAQSDSVLAVRQLSKIWRGSFNF